MGKNIKLNFCGFWSSFQPEDNLFTRILRRHFTVEISSEPDFVIVSNRGKPFEYMRYDCVRIMFMGENVSPDFTVFDYCIGFDHLEFGDRYFRLPVAFYNEKAEPWIPEPVTKETARRILDQKDIFCNFVYRHPSAHGMREKLFERLSEYKPCYSPGSYLNNIGRSTGISWREKTEVLKRSKFTIAGESIHYPGFATEKIVQPFQAHSIPVYFGSTTIEQDFNTNAFVLCRNEKDLDRTIEEVIRLDRDDEAYIEKLMQCPLPSKDALAARYERLEAFLTHIFAQEPVEAFRRVRHFRAEEHEKLLRDCMKREQPGLIDKAYGFYRTIRKKMRS